MELSRQVFAFLHFFAIQFASQRLQNAFSIRRTIKMHFLEKICRELRFSLIIFHLSLSFLLQLLSAKRRNNEAKAPNPHKITSCIVLSSGLSTPEPPFGIFTGGKFYCKFDIELETAILSIQKKKKC